MLNKILKEISNFIIQSGIDPEYYVDAFMVFMIVINWKYIRNWEKTSTVMKQWIIGQFILLAMALIATVIAILYPRKW
jgi:hypothetical protein